MKRLIYLPVVRSGTQRFFDKKALETDLDSITYYELITRIDRLAWNLKSITEREEIIGLYIDRNIDMVVSILAIMNAGCAFLPLSPKHPKVRIHEIVNSSGVKKIMTSVSYLQDLKGVNAEVIAVESFENMQSPRQRTQAIEDSQLAYVMYTSGSTGEPKGVLIEHHSMENTFLSFIESIGLCSEDTVLALTDYTFDISLLELVLPLTVGAKIVIAGEGAICSGNRIKGYIEKYEPTLIQATPLTWDILLKSGWKNEGRLNIISGGEELSTSLAERLDAHYGNVWNMYGPTETTIWSTFSKLNTLSHTQGVPIGLPIKNTEIYLLDENLDVVNDSEVGEICISGSGLARGYQNKKELTNSSFILHPGIQKRMYRTGDLGKRNSDGSYLYAGRLDKQIKIGGIRLEPGEVECVAEGLESVKKAVLVKKNSEGYCKQLVLYVEADEKRTGNLADEQAQLLDSWKSLYNTIYRESKERQLVQDNHSPSWSSSFVGHIFSREELYESTDFVVNKIQAMSKPRVLELGCGAGNLTLRALDFSSVYTAVDPSEEALQILREVVTTAQLEKLTIKNASVENISDQDKYDCILMHSVLQYFPSSTYLKESLDKVIGLADTNSVIILSDIRAAVLLDLFLLEKAYHESAEDQFDEAADFYMKRRDNELLVNAGYFESLIYEHERVSYVDINIRRGCYENELNTYRYDVVIHVDKKIDFYEPVEVDWSEIMEAQNIQSQFESSNGLPVIVNHVPNVAVIRKINKLYKRFRSQINNEGWSLMCISNSEYSMYSEMLKRFHVSHDLYMNYDESGDISRVKISFYPKGGLNLVRNSLHRKTGIKGCYFKEPFNLWAQNSLFSSITKKLDSLIPKCKHPSSIVWIEKWPRTSNGKIDRNKLSSLSGKDEFSIENTNMAIIYKIWFEITGWSVSLDENLFYTNMSSIYAHYFLATIRERLGIDVSFYEFSKNPTIRKMNSLLEERVGGSGVYSDRQERVVS